MTEPGLFENVQHICISEKQKMTSRSATPLRVVTLNVFGQHLGSLIEKVGSSDGGMPHIIAMQEVIGMDLAGTDVTIVTTIGPGCSPQGFPPGWTIIFVTTVDKPPNAYGHALLIRNGTGLSVVSSVSELIYPLPPGDPEVRKLLTTTLQNDSGDNFNVLSTHLSWTGTANSTTVKNTIYDIFSKPGRNIILGDFNTAWSYVREMANDYGIQIMPSRPTITASDRDGSLCVDYICANFSLLRNEKVNWIAGSDHRSVHATVPNVFVDGTGAAVYTIPGIDDKTETDTPSE